MIAFHDPGRCPEMNRPICVQPSTNVMYWLSSDGARRLIQYLEAAIRQMPPFPDPVELVECKNRPGVEMVVAVKRTNNLAYSYRVTLERRGFQCRTKRVGNGEHLVFATWPTVLAQKVEQMNERPLHPGQIQNWQAVALLQGWAEDYQEGRELLVTLGISALDVKQRYFSRLGELQNCGVVAVELRKWDGDHFGGRWIPAGKLDASKIQQESSAA